jgi:uncharacterized membrane protein YfcA
MWEELVGFIIMGFIAQLIDSSLGMGYGVISTTFLLGVGVSPAIASANVHVSEVFTTGLSGLSHLKFGNIDREIFKKLLLPGVLGGILGAYLLTKVPAKSIQPFIACYLLLIGIRIIYKTFSKTQIKPIKSNLSLLGAVGGFLDSIGGGGWGPIVTSSLVSKGNEPRYSIGSTNAVEFFITLAQSITFFILIGLVSLKIAISLVVGGIIAAPLSGYICQQLPAKILMRLVGLLLIALSFGNVLRIFYFLY